MVSKLLKKELNGGEIPGWVKFTEENEEGVGVHFCADGELTRAMEV